MTSDLGAFGRPRPRLTGVFARYRFAVAAFDQIALSVFAFALNICLLRALSATDYGILSLWLTIALFAVSIQAALVTGPLNIYLPGAKDRAAARALGAAIATVNLLAVLSTAAIVGVANFFGGAEWASRDPLTMVAIPLFIAAGMYREYYRSTAFSRHDMTMLLWVDGPYLAVTTVCLGAMVLWPQRFADLAVAFLSMTLGCLVSQLCVYVRRADGADRAAHRLFHAGWIGAYRRISGEIAWSLAGVFANHVQSRSYVYIATSLAGVASLATINAIGVLFRPVSVLVNAWGAAALPHLASALANGRIGEFDRAMAKAVAGAAFASAAIGVGLWFAWPPIQHYLLAGKYGDGILLLLPWAFASGASVLRYVGSVGLTAARDFKFLATTQTVCGALAAGATAGFILWQGYTGAMWGIAIGNGVCFVWEMGRLRGIRRRTLAFTAAAQSS